MEKEPQAIEAIAEPVATPEAAEVTLPTDDDLEAKYQALETEKEHYKTAFLKEKAKTKAPDFDPDEDVDDRIRRIAQETLEASRLADITREQDEILRRALKENKELKLAQRNKPDIPLSQTSSNEESAKVADTLVTKDQVADFKARGWTDKDIERYKQNLKKNSR